ncbi:MAG: hypothetical protein A2161_06685 [Candidatus Schekmanbacteria bacterium RBG_13_48_7]|uniref:Uncharacterized protein n=1 Tax=Candidatus Schekmanbacteria bacterium RBG_13_48_7 TaxID=1817878 RepID=A0A1F7RL37_9BACT|nr:MAG: hypothetical protein A2161_06685 [Candidatus Schekmanbacteria bacterium RBG_13_48_7]
MDFYHQGKHFFPELVLHDIHGKFRKRWKEPSESNPPFVVKTCRWWFHRAYSQRVWMETMMPG